MTLIVNLIFSHFHWTSSQLKISLILEKNVYPRLKIMLNNMKFSSKIWQDVYKNNHLFLDFVVIS